MSISFFTQSEACSPPLKSMKPRCSKHCANGFRCDSVIGMIPIDHSCVIKRIESRKQQYPLSSVMFMDE